MQPRRTFDCLSVLLALVQLTAASGQVRQLPPQERDVVYLARVFSISEQRDQVLDSLEMAAVPIWSKLFEEGYLVRQNLFESVEVFSAETGVPQWKYLLLTQVSDNTSVEDLLGRESSFLGSEQAFNQLGLKLLRSETLVPTPNSYYPDGLNSDLEVKYFIEYIAAREDPELLAEYCSIVAEYFGVGEGLLISERKRSSFIALETSKVLFLDPTMPRWNQIHVMGIFPEVGFENILEAVMRVKGIDRGRMSSIVERVISIRTKPREDWARDLPKFRIE